MIQRHINSKKKEMKTTLSILAIGLIILSIITWFFYNRAMDIAIEQPAIIQPTQTESEKEVIYFGVVSRYAPSMIYKGYQPVMDWLSSVTPYKFELKLSTSYQETVSQLANKEVTAAFLGTFIYLDAHKEYGIRCIARPLNKELKPYFHSVLISREDSDIRTLKDLKDKRLALPSVYSFSGNWLLKSELKKHGLGLMDFDSINHFNYHHTVAYQVLKDHFQAGVVKDRVATEFLGHGLRIIQKSGPIPASPIVVSQHANTQVVKAIQKALLEIDINNPKFKKIMENWDKEFAYGFKTAQDSDYDSLRRAVQTWGNK